MKRNKQQCRIARRANKPVPPPQPAQQLPVIYFALHDVTGEFVAITHGEQGYFETRIYTQEHADRLNELAGHTPATIQAAMTCSHQGSWDNFGALI